MRTRHPYICALIVVVALLAFVCQGCGGSDNEDAEAANNTAVAKAIYVEKGDQICKSNYAKRTQVLTQLRKKYPGSKNLPPIARQEDILVKQIMPIFWEESEELNDLPLPNEGADEAEKILAALEKSIEGVEADPARSLREGTGIEFESTEQLAQDYGYEWCGRS
jgi:hypothetical protein